MSRGIGRNDPCWCGSGKKFKKCHIDREQQRPLPASALLSAFREAQAWETCLHPEASKATCSKVIRAHTVQRARTLERLVDESNHVRTFFPYAPADESGTLTHHRRGWREASTFTGFCAKHDSATFAPIENAEEKASAEWAFLFCYRALCHELYQKLSVQQASPTLAELADRGLRVEQQQFLQRAYAAAAAGRSKAIVHLQRAKSLADKDLLDRSYNSLRYVVLLFEGQLCLATSGTPTPNRDLDGTSLQVLHAPAEPVQHLYLSVASYRTSGVVVVFGWRPEHSAPARLLTSLMSRDRTLLGSYVAQYVFAHLENVYFSDSWWSSLSDTQQDHIRNLAANANPYYEQPKYIDEMIVPWTLSSIVEDDGWGA
jgi:hypothetical protein